MVEVRNNGVPLIEQAPKAAITQSLVLLAEKLSGSDKLHEPEGEQPKSSTSIGRLFPFWSGKAKPAGK